MSLSRDRTRSQFRRSRADAGRHLSCRSRSALQCRSRSRLGSQTLRSTRREPGGSRRQPGSAQTSFRPGVGGLVDLAHPARGEGGVDLVRAERGARGEGHQFVGTRRVSSSNSSGRQSSILMSPRVQTARGIRNTAVVPPTPSRCCSNRIRTRSRRRRGEDARGRWIAVLSRWIGDDAARRPTGWCSRLVT